MFELVIGPGGSGIASRTGGKEVSRPGVFPANCLGSADCLLKSETQTKATKLQSEGQVSRALSSSRSTQNASDREATTPPNVVEADKLRRHAAVDATDLDIDYLSIASTKLN